MSLNVFNSKLIVELTVKTKELTSYLEEYLKDIVGLQSLKDHLKHVIMTMMGSKIISVPTNKTPTYKRPVMILSGNPGTGKTFIASLVASEYIHLRHNCGVPTDMHQRSQNLRYLYFGMGLSLEFFRFFSRNQNNRGPSGAYVTASAAVWPWRQIASLSMAPELDRERIGFAFLFVCMVGKKRKTPKLSPMADDAITRGGRRSGISRVYLWVSPKQNCGVPRSGVHIHSFAGCKGICNTIHYNTIATG